MFEPIARIITIVLIGPTCFVFCTIACCTDVHQSDMLSSSSSSSSLQRSEPGRTLLGLLFASNLVCTRPPTVVECSGTAREERLALLVSTSATTCIIAMSESPFTHASCGSEPSHMPACELPSSFLHTCARTCTHSLQRCSVVCGAHWCSGVGRACLAGSSRSYYCTYLSTHSHN